MVKRWQQWITTVQSRMHMQVLIRTSLKHFFKPPGSWADQVQLDSRSRRSPCRRQPLSTHCFRGKSIRKSGWNVVKQCHVCHPWLAMDGNSFFFMLHQQENGDDWGMVLVLPTWFEHLQGIFLQQIRELVYPPVRHGLLENPPGIVRWFSSLNPYLVGGLEHVSCFHIFGNVIIPTDFHLFQRGRLNHQPAICGFHLPCLITAWCNGLKTTFLSPMAWWKSICLAPV